MSSSWIKRADALMSSLWNHMGTEMLWCHHHAFGICYCQKIPFTIWWYLAAHFSDSLHHVPHLVYPTEAKINRSFPIHPTRYIKIPLRKKMTIPSDIKSTPSDINQPQVAQGILVPDHLGGSCVTFAQKNLKLLELFQDHFCWWVFPKIGIPQNGWFIMQNPIKIDDLGVPSFLETPWCRFGFLMISSVDLHGMIAMKRGLSMISTDFWRQIVLFLLRLCWNQSSSPMAGRIAESQAAWELTTSQRCHLEPSSWRNGSQSSRKSPIAKKLENIIQLTLKWECKQSDPVEYTSIRLLMSISNQILTWTYLFHPFSHPKSTGENSSAFAKDRFICGQSTYPPRTKALWRACSFHHWFPFIRGTNNKGVGP